MKRSEILDVIEKSLENINIPGYDRRLAERILFFIETFSEVLQLCSDDFRHNLRLTLAW